MVDENVNNHSGVLGGQVRRVTGISPAQITSNQNNFLPTNGFSSSRWRLDLDAARSITGIGDAAQVDGIEILLENISAFDLTLAHESGSSTAANRFDLGDDTDVTVAGGALALLSYDATTARWRVVAGGGGGGSGLIITAVSVSDITDPSTELNAIAGATKGDMALCYETNAAQDESTLYMWDDADSGSEVVPYSVDGSSGIWLAHSGLYVNGTVNVQTEVVVRTLPIFESQAYTLSTGLISGGFLSINGGDNTKVDISAGEGYILDKNSVPATPTWKHIVWTAFTALTPTHSANGFTAFAIDNTGSIVENTTAWSNSQRKTYIVLGSSITPGGSVVTDVTDNSSDSTTDYLSSELAGAIGMINLSGNTYTAGGANLTLQRAAGSTFEVSSNRVNDDTDSNVLDTIADAGVTFNYIYSDGASGVTTIVAETDVDPDQYDDGSGTLAAIANNKWTNQLIYWFPDASAALVQYAEEIYDSQADAVEAAPSQAFTVLVPGLDATGLRTVLSVKKGSTDLSDTASASFTQSGRFGHGASGGSTSALQNLQGVYNQSVTPQILTDATRGSLDIRRGSGADTDNIQRWQNNAGTSTAAVTGEGKLTAAAIILGSNEASDLLLAGDSVSAVDTNVASTGYIDAHYAASAASLTDNAVLRGDGGSLGIQDSSVLIDDSDNITGVANITASGLTLGGNAATDLLLAADPKSASDTANVSAGYVAEHGNSTFLVAQTTHGLTTLNVIKSSGTAGEYAKAQADSAANAEAVGLCTVTDSNNIVVYPAGTIITGTTGEWDAIAGTTGGLDEAIAYYIDASTAGALTATEPSTNTNISKPMIIGISTTQAVVVNYRGFEIGDPAATIATAATAANLIWKSGGTDRTLVESGITIDASDVMDGVGGINFGDEDLTAYDTGTWTPVLTGSSTAGSHTYSIQSGEYIRVGQLVYVLCAIQISSKDGTMAGNIEVTGFPFTVKNTAGSFAGGVVSYAKDFTFVDVITVQFLKNTTKALMSEIPSGGTGSALTDADIGTTPQIYFSGIYEVA